MTTLTPEMNKNYWTCPRCGMNHDCDPQGSRYFSKEEVALAQAQETKAGATIKCPDCQGSGDCAVYTGISEVCGRCGGTGLLPYPGPFPELKQVVDHLDGIKGLLDVVNLAVESQGWDGNNPDNDRWITFYEKARDAKKAWGLK